MSGPVGKPRRLGLGLLRLTSLPRERGRSHEASPRLGTSRAHSPVTASESQRDSRTVSRLAPCLHLPEMFCLAVRKVALIVRTHAKR